MRIISGIYRGKYIKFIKSDITRPLKDIVKENIFNILQHSKKINISVERSNVLDLYSGVGSFGLECISRGANNVTFIEKNKNAFDLINENLKSLSISNYAFLINKSIENSLNLIKREKYSIIFLDPPYKDNQYIKNLLLLKKNKNFEKDYLVIIHRENRSSENFNDLLDILIEKKYGRSKIYFGKFI